jgi:hypothetical protein
MDFVYFFDYLCHYILFHGIKYIKGKKIDYRIKKTLFTIGILAVPCLLHVLMFKNHSLIHDFSILKFSILFATIPFVFAPLLIYLVLKDLKFKEIILKKYKLNYLFILSLLCLATASGCIIYENPKETRLFPNSTNYEDLGYSIHKNTDYNDIVFSPDIEIEINPPQLLSYSMKRVYKINSSNEIKEKLKGINGDYRVVILFVNNTEEYEILNDSTLIRDGNYYYYRINPNNIQS